MSEEFIGNMQGWENIMLIHSGQQVTKEFTGA